MKEKVLSMVKILVGVALTDIALGMIILPQSFAAGGVTGLCVIISKMIPLPVSILVLICNAILFILGYIFIGKEFIFKTLIVSIIFPIGLDLCQKYNFLAEMNSDPLMSAILAGVLIGAGTGLVLLGDGSSGGFDIIGVILHKYFKVPVSIVMNVCDITVILIQVASNPSFSPINLEKLCTFIKCWIRLGSPLSNSIIFIINSSNIFITCIYCSTKRKRPEGLNVIMYSLFQ